MRGHEKPAPARREAAVIAGDVVEDVVALRSWVRMVPTPAVTYGEADPDEPPTESPDDLPITVCTLESNRADRIVAPPVNERSLA